MNVEKPHVKKPETWIPKGVFLSYMGDESCSDFYDAAVSSKNMYSISFNWVSFFFLPFWLGMRRQII